MVAYARNPAKEDIENKNLSIVVGEISDYDKILQAVSGSEAVINALGLPMNPTVKEFPAVTANELIIKAMQATGVKRYITWDTPSVHAEGDSKSYITVISGILAGVFLRRAKKAMIKIATDVVKSGLDWTIVRFMAPKDTPFTGKVKVSFGKEKLSFNIARADIAGFMLDQLNNTEYIKKMPIIGS